MVGGQLAGLDGQPKLYGGGPIKILEILILNILLVASWNKKDSYKVFWKPNLMRWID